MYRCFLVVTAISMMTMTSDAQDQPESKKDTDIVQKNPIGYFLGLAMGQQLLEQGLNADDFDSRAVAAGIMDAIGRKELRLSDEQLAKTQEQFQQMMNARHQKMFEDIQKKALANKKRGEEWLQANLKKEGVKELKGGLQYKVLEEGEGPSPGPSDKVKVHYTGKLVNGEVFDSSVERGRPAEFVVGGVIKGWQMALQEMKVGGKWMLYIPSELAYGEQGSRGAIGPNEALIFEVELLEIL